MMPSDLPGAVLVTLVLPFRPALVLTATLAVAACRGEDPAGSATDTDTTTTTTTNEPEPTTSSTGIPTTSTTSSSTTDVTTAEPEPTTSDTSAGFITTDPTDPSGSGLLPNGSMCETGAQCESMKCYTNPALGGLCSECESDTDCVNAGTGTSCSLGLDGATCKAGAYGDQCMSQAACMDGLLCGPVIQVPLPGLLPDTCGECMKSADCEAGVICTPEFDIAAFTGAKKCAEPGSVQNGELCPVGEGDADDVCASGHCGEVTFMAILTVGVCGECKSDDDCPGGTCIPGEVSQNGVSGSVCQ